MERCYPILAVNDVKDGLKCDSSYCTIQKRQHNRQTDDTTFYLIMRPTSLTGMRSYGSVQYSSMET